MPIGEKIWTRPMIISLAAVYISPGSAWSYADISELLNVTGM
jgi:hypothetical protein